MRRHLALVLLAACGFQASRESGRDLVDAASGADVPAVVDATNDVDASPDAADASSNAPQCPAGYDAISGATGLATSSYKFVVTQLAWDAAEADCEDDAPNGSNLRATHLIVLDDLSERDRMIGGPTGGGNINDQWIGATDLFDEGTPNYVTTQQSPHQLSGGSGNSDNKDCIRFKNDASHEYRTCTETNRYVCECDGRSADPNRFPSLPNGNN